MLGNRYELDPSLSECELYILVNEDGSVVDLFWGKWGASELDLISMDIKSLLHCLLPCFFDETIVYYFVPHDNIYVR